MQEFSYLSYSDINELQQDIINFMISWAKKKQTPIPLTNIITNMKSRNIKRLTTLNAINSLIYKKYIRRAVYPIGRCFFVLLRWH
jgi:hypothetical protein